MTDPDVLAAIYARIAQQLTAYPIAWPGVSFTPPAGPYLRVNTLPGRTEAVGLSTLDDTESLVQIDVLMPAGGGTIAAATLVKAVIGAFPRNLRLDAQGVRINFDRTGWAGASLQDGDRLMVPVSIPYRVLT